MSSFMVVRIVDIPRALVSKKPPFWPLSGDRARSKLGPVPCLLGCLALSMPRIVLALVWLFSDYLDTVFYTRIWPFLGFLFLPLTTLAYAFAMHFGQMQWTPIGVAAVVTGVLVDLGLIRTGNSARGGGGARVISVKGEKVG
jgi:hypothetical protein